MIGQTFALAMIAAFSAAAGPSSPSSPDELTLDEVVAAHEATIGKIQSLDATVEKIPVDKSRRVQRRIDRWRKQGPLEKYESQTEQQAPDSKGTIFSMVVVSRDYDSMMEKLLKCPKAKDLASIPLENASLSARRGPFKRNHLEFGCYGYLLWRFALNANDDGRTLKELVAESQKATLSGNTDVGGHECYQIDIVHPGVAGKDVGARMRVFLDPQAGFLARRRDVEFSPPTLTGNEPERISQTVTEVIEFADGGSGAFFPVSIENYVLSPEGDRTFENRYEVKLSSLNTEIPPAELDFQFPENTIVKVYDKPVSATVPAALSKYELIGREGKVIREFPSDGKALGAYQQAKQDEALSLEGEAQPEENLDRPSKASDASTPKRAPQAGSLYIPVGAGIAIVVLGAAGWYRLRSQKRRAA